MQWPGFKSLRLAETAFDRALAKDLSKFSQYVDEVATRVALFVEQEPISSDVSLPTPVDATYVTLSANAVLTDERVLSAGNGISVADGGPGGAVTVSNVLTSSAPADVDLSPAAVGVAVLAARADHKHDLKENIAPLWTGIHTFSAQDVHNAGVSLGTSGDMTSVVTDASDAAWLDFQATSPGATATFDRYLLRVRNSTGFAPLIVASDGSVTFNSSSGVVGGQPSAILNASGPLQGASAALSGGAQFNPTGLTSPGATVAGKANMTYGGAFSARTSTDAANVRVFSGLFFGGSFNQGRAHTEYYGALVNSFVSTTPTGTATSTEGGGLLIETATGSSGGTGTITDFHQLRIKNARTSTRPAITTLYGIRLAQMTSGTTNYGMMLESASPTYKAAVFGDANAWVGGTGGDLSLNGSTFNVLFYDNEIVSYDDDMVTY